MVEVLAQFRVFRKSYTTTMSSSWWKWVRSKPGAEV